MVFFEYRKGSWLGRGRGEGMVRDQHAPYALDDPEEGRNRRARLQEAHIAPLTAFVERLRATTGHADAVPYFDPLDGGVAAELLFLLEAPGPKAVGSGFVSRNNPDRTALNLCLLLQQAGIPRRATVLWNIVPWYIGTGSRIRPPTGADIGAGLRTLPLLLQLLPRLRAVVLVGGSAKGAHRRIAQMVRLPIHHVPHPSPRFINRNPQNRRRLLAALRQVRHSTNI